ncbi:hypothetical protein K443DRAFT_154220 [Laccaria amethystina LaAM-08-1]|uniref:Uncharacterized protein n=1 Tax=Laccaria amethystina LaAM-08-1 TaxID=1095629 RepID=A0A0C9XVG7_9AGAR|nr:hypothetical protein K443DRAFT_154220 [Laccaria amethystina LaAM-08-1]
MYTHSILLRSPLRVQAFPCPCFCQLEHDHVERGCSRDKCEKVWPTSRGSRSGCRHSEQFMTSTTGSNLYLSPPLNVDGKDDRARNEQNLRHRNNPKRTRAKDR